MSQEAEQCQNVDENVQQEGAEEPDVEMQDPVEDDQEPVEDDHVGEGEGEGEQGVEPGNPDPYLWWDGEMPQANGRLATFWSQNGVTPAVQRADAAAILRAVTAMTPLVNGLARSSKPNPFLAAIPGTSKVRLVYGMEAIFASDRFDDHILHFKVLSGEIPEGSSSHPTVYTLPAPTIESFAVMVPTNAYIQEHGAEWSEANYYFKREAQVAAMADDDKEEVQVCSIAPVPLFACMDAIEDDIDARILWERLGALDEADTDPCITHTRNFLRACMVKFNRNTLCPQNTNEAVWARRPIPEDTTWANKRIAHLYPAIKHREEAGTPATGPATVDRPNQGNGNIPMTPETLRQLMREVRISDHGCGAAGRRNNNEIIDVDREDNKEPQTMAEELGVSDETVATILHWCQLKEDEEQLIPEFIKKAHLKKTSTEGKNRILTGQILDFRAFMDVETHLKPTVLSFFREHNYAGICDPTVTLYNCTKGVSMFSLGRDSYEARGQMELDSECLSLASVTTTADYRKQQESTKPTTPSTWEGFKGYLCRFINITGPLSDNRALIYEDAKDVYAHMCNWSAESRNALKQKNFAAIMWAFALQNRYYFLDPRAKSVPCHPAFGRMLNDIKSHQVFGMAGIPHQLTGVEIICPTYGGGTSSMNKRKKEHDEDNNEGGGFKRDKGDHTTKDFSHPIIKVALGRELQKLKDKDIRLGKLCKCYGISVGSLVPAGKCANASIFGKCTYARCNRSHGKLKDEQARKAVEQLQPFIANPKRIFEQAEGNNEGQ